MPPHFQRSLVNLLVECPLQTGKFFVIIEKKLYNVEACAVADGSRTLFRGINT